MITVILVAHKMETKQFTDELAYVHNIKITLQYVHTTIM